MPAFRSPAFKNVSIVRDGVRYNASWHVDDATVQVSSAYGSKSGPLGNRDALEVAEALLADIVVSQRP